jgi:hypothetical protein
VYIRNEVGQYEEDVEWSGDLSVNWDQPVVRDTMADQMSNEYKLNQELFRFNPPPEQNAHKVTCTVHVGILQQVSQKGSADEGWGMICQGWLLAP